MLIKGAKIAVRVAPNVAKVNHQYERISDVVESSSELIVPYQRFEILVKWYVLEHRRK